MLTLHYALPCVAKTKTNNREKKWHIFIVCPWKNPHSWTTAHLKTKYYGGQNMYPAFKFQCSSSQISLYSLCWQFYDFGTTKMYDKKESPGYTCISGYCSSTCLRCLSTIVWTQAVLGVLYAWILHVSICCSVLFSMFHIERCSTNTIIITIIIIIITIITTSSIALYLTVHTVLQTPQAT